MNVTINTDASVVANKYAGFAFWIVCNDGRIQKAGYIKQKVTNPNDAEMFCIANALHTLLHSRFKGVSKVVLNTDSEQCIKMLNGDISVPTKSKIIRKGYDESTVLMYEILLKHGKNIRDINEFFSLRHVRAHTGTQDARSKVNEWCDRQAKLYAKRLYQASK